MVLALPRLLVCVCVYVCVSVCVCEGEIRTLSPFVANVKLHLYKYYKTCTSFVLVSTIRLILNAFS